MSAARQLHAAEHAESISADDSGIYPAGTSQRPVGHQGHLTPEQGEHRQQAWSARQARRKVATVMVFVLLTIAAGLSVFALTGIVAKVAAGTIGGVILAAVAVAPTGRLDP